ncbi:MAG: hypothetical protein C5B50_04380 [Verrucomicrobia bacterium]|nr:MAG: hypothetical protein C5B50_04380 [Verrucomicrobiota bacterium]
MCSPIIKPQTNLSATTVSLRRDERRMRPNGAHYGVGQAFEPAGSGGFPAPGTPHLRGTRRWKAPLTGRLESLPYKGLPALRICGGLASLLLLTQLVAAPLFAQEPSYLHPGHPDPIVLLAPPPLPGSAEQAADLASARAVFRAHTTNDAVLAELETKLSVFSFASAIGPQFQPDRLPKTAAFFKRVLKDTKEVVDAGKEHWKRHRPYYEDASLASGEMEKTYSYPSGHSTRATVQALLLAEAVPDKTDAILDLGRGIGWRRVLLGHHYPTDIYAGRCLGQAVVRELKSNPAFVKDFAEVKAEITAALSPKESRIPGSVGVSPASR